MPHPGIMTSVEAASDAELVAASLAGDREAFGHIVARYQRLLCSLAYSAVGRVSESEDIAQESFVTAWKQLPALREPDKLRSWLCGILRHQVSRHRRRDGREPVRQADVLDAASDVRSADACTADQTMNNEEQTILWNVLERLPERYREPLVLYYRQNRSIEHVAAELDLTEDAVKQRLHRGRRMIQEQVLAFVEGALARSTPAKAFTVGVLAMLPAMLPAPAKAAGIGAVAAHGSVFAKSTGIAALLASVTGVVNFILSLRAAMEQTRTPRERRTVVMGASLCFGGAMAFLLALYGLRAASWKWWEHREVLAWTGQAVVFAFIVILPVSMLWMLRHFRRMRTEERRLHPEAFNNPIDHIGATTGEYRSKAHLFGVPLVHVRFALPDVGARPVFAWFAAGDRAVGLLFAWGNVVAAPVSVGVVSVGLLSVGALGFGVIGLGTVGVGWLAVGCITVGYRAYAWLSASGWLTAQSAGFAVAGTGAEAPVALAPHANDAIARAMLADPNAGQNQMIFFIVIVFFSLVPLIYYTREIRRRLGVQARAAAARDARG